ncbi:MAG: FkbM family methyltransferase [Saprospiraceae bacterium]|nr:FkbM family methyltransferase [Saprospiraceae bacterium]
MKNCSIVNIAASNKIGVSDFNYVTSNPSYSGLLKRDYDKPNEIDTTISVKTELLDNIIPADISIDLIKIDVEGAELLVLEGAYKLIKKYKPIVIFECGIGASNYYGTTPSKLFDFSI